jgi:UDP-N-acetylglucosamine acyltransferase
LALDERNAAHSVRARYLAQALEMVFMGIHPTAIVHPTAKLGEVTIGPYAIVGEGVTLGDGVQVEAHGVVLGPTEIGAGTRVHSHAVIGDSPQVVGGTQGPSRLVIGKNNIFREHATAHRGSSEAQGLTSIGDGNYFMAYSHVAHDCDVGSGCIFANSAAIAGHVSVADGVVIGGLAGVHQHARIGRLSMVAAGSMCAQDVPPFTLAKGDRVRLFGLNVVGLRRASMPQEVIEQLKSAWNSLFVSGSSRRGAMSKVRARFPDSPEVGELVDFLEGTRRGVARAAVADD